MEQALLDAGLSKQQARAYIFLLDNYPSTPSNIAKQLKLTRTNAYKLCDKLTEIGLVTKDENGKKIAYEPADPIALSGLVAEARTKMIALEQATKQAMKLARNRLQADDTSTVKLYRGKNATIELFKAQARNNLPIYFVSSAADLPVMGFDTMHRIRNITGPKHSPRYGITPDVPGAVKDPELDKQSRLERTWIARDDYTSPVEWSACGNDLNIFIYASEPYSIKISDKHVAAAFRQLWHSLNLGLREAKSYKTMPHYADRTVWHL